jgi:hypothetical protein
VREILVLGGLDPLVAGLVFNGAELIRGPANFQVRVRTDDPRLTTFASLGRTLDRRPHSWWQYRRTYTRAEVARAELFNLNVTAHWWPGPEAYGTKYDYSGACHVGQPVEKKLAFDAWWPYSMDGSEQCGAGRVQVSDLVLDLARAPVGKEIAQTDGDEWLVSEKLATLLSHNAISGVSFRPIQDAAKRRSVRPAAWFQLVFSGKSANVVEPTRFGDGPFDPNPDGSTKCPLGHTSGLHLLSELHLSRGSWDGSDVVRTQELVGFRAGGTRSTVPKPMILISQGVRRLLAEHRIKGCDPEIAHLVG